MSRRHTYDGIGALSRPRGFRRKVVLAGERVIKSQRDRYWQKRAVGCCAICSSQSKAVPAKPGRAVCGTCRTYFRRWTERDRARRRAAGQCYSCSRDLVPGCSMCLQHRTRHRKMCVARLAALRRQRLCLDCRCKLREHCKMLRCFACRLIRRQVASAAAAIQKGRANA